MGIMVAKYDALLYVLRDLNRTVIWTDIDSMWLDPCALSYLTSAPLEVDIIGQRGLSPIAIANVTGAVVCSGYFMVRPSKNSVALMEAVLRCVMRYRDDQKCLNELILERGGFDFGAGRKLEYSNSDFITDITNGTHCRSRNITIGLLPYRQFPRGIAITHPANKRTPRSRNRTRSSSSRMNELRQFRNNSQRWREYYEKTKNKRDRVRTSSQRDDDKTVYSVILGTMRGLFQGLLNIFTGQSYSDHIAELTKENHPANSATNGFSAQSELTRFGSRVDNITKTRRREKPNNRPNNRTKRSLRGRAGSDMNTRSRASTHGDRRTNRGTEADMRRKHDAGVHAPSSSTTSATDEAEDVDSEAVEADNSPLLASVKTNLAAAVNKTDKPDPLAVEWSMLSKGACIWHRLAAKNGGSKLTALKRDGMLLLDEGWLNRSESNNLTAAEVQKYLYLKS
jgi:hypothetical protein